MCLICDSLYVIEFTKIKVVVGSWLARSFANSGEILRNKQDDLRWVPRGGWDCVIIFLLSLVVVNKILCLVASAFRLDDAWPSYCVLVILEAYYCFQYIVSSLGSRECIKAANEDAALTSRKLGSIFEQVHGLPPSTVIFWFAESLQVGWPYSTTGCYCLFAFRVVVLYFVELLWFFSCIMLDCVGVL